MIEPIKSGDDSRLNWRTINALSSLVNGLSVPNQGRDSGIAGLRQRPRDIGSSPFAIIETAPLTYRVVDNPSLLITTGEPVTITDLDTDFVLTTGVEFYWFYLDITDATNAAVDTSAIPLAWDQYTIPLGWVDTVEDPPVIHQFVHDNIFAPCVV